MLVINKTSHCGLCHSLPLKALSPKDVQKFFDKKLTKINYPAASGRGLTTRQWQVCY